MLDEQVSGKGRRGRGEKAPAVAGHNRDELLKGYLEKLMAEQKIAIDSRGRSKDILAQAKNDGFGKMALRKLVKHKMKTQEQIQADQEVEREFEEYVAITEQLTFGL